jgi:arylsulfatase
MFLLTAVAARAQQTTGVPCSPSAATTIDGKYIPPPPAPFGGEIGLDASQSKPCWPARVVPPKGAPNVLLIMTDEESRELQLTSRFKSLLEPFIPLVKQQPSVL